MKTFPFPGHSMLLPDIVRAENCSLFDAAGNRYVDMEAGVWCTSIGHGNEAVKAAITGQLNSVGHAGFCYSSSVVDNAAGAVQEILGHEGGRCSFLCSGSEAVEYGVRTMRTVLGETALMTMGDSYFGAYGDAAGKNKDWFIFDWFECEGCAYDQCTDACPRWKSIPFERIGGFLLEPGSSSGLVRFPPVQLIKAIVRTIQDKGGLFMVNEVTTGVGRTGTWFGHQHYGVQPDVAALGKGIGNGYPVSVSSITANMADRLGNAPIPFGSSHYNDPLGASVVSAVVDYIEQNGLIDRARHLSDILVGGLEDIAARSRRDITVRGRGLMAIIDLGMEPDEATEYHHRLVREGFICAHRPQSSVLRMDPALTIEEADLRAFLTAIESLLD